MRATFIGGAAVGCALAMALSVPARAQESRHPAQLLELLDVIDELPTHEQLVAAGAGQDGAALRDVLTDASLPRYARMRAASALAWFPADANTQLLVDVASQPSWDRPIRVLAISALAIDRTPGRAGEIDACLRALLADPDADIQAAAVHAAVGLDAGRRAAVLEGAVEALQPQNASLEPLIREALGTP